MNVKKIIRFILLLLFLVFITGCNGTIDDNHPTTCTFAYSVTGNGSIYCSIDSGTVVKYGKIINLSATANGEDTFDGWYIEEKLYSEKTSLQFTIQKDTSIVAKFNGTNYKDEETTNIELLEGVVSIFNGRGFTIKNMIDMRKLEAGLN